MLFASQRVLGLCEVSLLSQKKSSSFFEIFGYSSAPLPCLGGHIDPLEGELITGRDFVYSTLKFQPTLFPTLSFDFCGGTPFQGRLLFDSGLFKTSRFENVFCRINLN